MTVPNAIELGVACQKGPGLFPETQMFKDLLDDIRLVDEADDAPFEFPQGGELVEPSRHSGQVRGSVS